MKLLHVVTGVNVGGAETMLARLLECGHLAPDIHPEVISLMRPGYVGERIVAAGTPLHSLDMASGVPSLTAAARLAGLVRGIRPDLIMGWMHHGQLAASFAALMSPDRPSVIWNVRHSLSGFAREKPLTRMVLRLGRWISRTPAAIIYNSRAASRQYAAFGYSAERSIVIPNGFTSSGYRPRDEAAAALRTLFGLPEQGLLIGMIARAHLMKDLPNLLTAFGSMLERCPDAHLLVAGEGMDRPGPEVAKLLSSLPRRSWTLAGHRADVASWLAGLDILALPSAWGEGLPNIVGEAMACGVCCVATDVGDSAWLIGKAGRSVPPGDSAALASALVELATLGPDGREVLGRAARARIGQQFALERVAERYFRFCRDHARVRASSAVPVLAAVGDVR